MPEPHFFTTATSDASIFLQYCESDDILKIFDEIPDHSILITDIDDTIGRLPYTIGIDPWFLFKIQQYISEELSDSEAKEKAVALYTAIQLISTKMVPLHKTIDIGLAIEKLKERGVTVIGLTARNHRIIDNTHQQLTSIGVTFSEGFLAARTFEVEGKKVEIERGGVFCNGVNKGAVLAYLKDNLLSTSPKKIVYIDDSSRNCQHVRDELSKWKIDHLVCHYQYRARHLPFTNEHKQITAIQESHFMAHHEILSDEQVILRSGMHE